MSVRDQLLLGPSAIEANRNRACCAIASNDVLSSIDEVREDILSATTATPTPNPSPQGGGEHTVFAARTYHAMK